MQDRPPQIIAEAGLFVLGIQLTSFSPSILSSNCSEALSNRRFHASVCLSDVDDALVLLQEAVEKEITSTNDEGAELLRRGQLGQAKKQVEKSERLESFKKQVDALRRSYGKIEASGRRRMVGQRVGGTPQEDFHEPILKVLRQMGGKGKAREVVIQVGALMGARLDNEIDQELLSGGDPRWMNRCWWGRNDLREAGKLRSDSLRGTWELS